MLPLVESSFKQLVRANPAGFNKSVVVEVMKNIKAQSFDGSDFFTHPIIDQKNQVKMIVNGFRNTMEEYTWRRTCKFKCAYEPYLTGMTIPLKVQGNDLYHKARLVIAWPIAYGRPQIAIQFLLSKEQTWVTVPCRTTTVCTAFYALFPQEDGRYI